MDVYGKTDIGRERVLHGKALRQACARQARVISSTPVCRKPKEPQRERKTGINRSREGLQRTV